MLLNILPSLLSGTLETLRVFALTLLCSLPGPVPGFRAESRQSTAE